LGKRTSRCIGQESRWKPSRIGPGGLFVTKSAPDIERVLMRSAKPFAPFN
jgi:hypothetical protein